MGSGEHIKAGGLQSFSEEQLPFAIFQRPPSALLLALMFFRWNQNFKMLDYREKNVEENAISPPASFPHLLKGSILQVVLRQNCSQWGKEVFQDGSKVGSAHRAIGSCLCCFVRVRQQPETLWGDLLFPRCRYSSLHGARRFEVSRHRCKTPACYGNVDLVRITSLLQNAALSFSLL